VNSAGGPLLQEVLRSGLLLEGTLFLVRPSLDLALTALLGHVRLLFVLLFAYISETMKTAGLLCPGR
jgi:hypothetical protein